MKQEHLQKPVVGRFAVSAVQLDELTSVKFIFSVNTCIFFELFLAAARQMEQVFVRAYLFIDVALSVGRKGKQRMFLAFCL